MTPHAHDLITSIAVAVLLAGMLPAVWRRSQLPLSSCAVTSSVCEVLSVNWATSGYWYSTVVEFATATCWLALLQIALPAHPHRLRAARAGAAAGWTLTGAVICLCAATHIGHEVDSGTHGAIVAVSVLVLTGALAPAVYRCSALPVSSCVITGAAVSVLAVNFATMGYWYAAVIEAVNAACWAFLLSVSLGARYAPKQAHRAA